MIQKILCPTDLSDNSRESVAYALRLAKENAAQLILFYATSFPSFTYYPCELEPFYQWAELVSKSKMDRILTDAENRVKNFVCTRFRAESNGVVWKARVALGKTSEEVVTAALPGRSRSHRHGPVHKSDARSHIHIQHFGNGKPGRALSGSLD